MTGSGSSGWWWRRISRFPGRGRTGWTSCCCRRGGAWCMTRSRRRSLRSRSRSTAFRISTSSWRTGRRMTMETRKILDPDIKVIATCVRVPVFIGHAEAVHVEFEEKVTVAEARTVLRAAPGGRVMDTREDGGYMTQLECQGEDDTYVSRLRVDPTVENGLAFWCVSDNL